MHHKIVKKSLTKQMEQKVISKAEEIKQKHDGENELMQLNQMTMEMQKQKAKEIKEKEKKHWEDELERVRMATLTHD